MADAPPHLPPAVADLQCCCGGADCVFLKHSCSVLDSVEKDVHTAAKMGQALLERHEAYMAHAERDRLELTARIGQLETDKRDLEVENAKKVEENGSLREQLDLLNTAVADSDTRVKALEATLRSSQQTVRHLEGAAIRAAEMERHLAILEMEQATLQNNLVTTESEARSALQRWRKAERGILELQAQLERMEKEATDERDRHAEVLGRMERQRAMERELDAAAGRLKGAAGARASNNPKPGGSIVVSHFVRDLLQDNATLQLGIAELRDLLINSNDEIQTLREQLFYHQPLPESDVSATSTLRAELEPVGEPSPPRRSGHTPSVSQELHIHHHYHVSNKAEPRRIKKKRQGLSTGVFTPPALGPATSPNGAGRFQRAPPAPSILAHAARDSVSTVSGPSNRWSLFSDQPSEFAPSSVPSSPLSNPRYSMFDRGIMDLSIPPSPTTSVDPMSPTCRIGHSKRASEVSIAAIPILEQQDLAIEPFLLQPTTDGVPDQSRLLSTPKPHENGHLLDASPVSMDDALGLYTNGDTSLGTTPVAVPHPSIPSVELRPPDGDEIEDYDDQSNSSQHTMSPPPSPARPSLHRAVSHESIMSLSGGLDIHTLRMRPSQLSLRPLGAVTADIGLSAVTARPTISRGTNGGKRGSVVLRDSLTAGLPMPRTRTVSGPGTPGPSADSSPRTPSAAAKLGRLVAWRPWGGASSGVGPEASVTTASPTSPLTPTTPTGTVVGRRQEDLGRARGINQAGAIPGFYEFWAAHQRRGPPSRVLPEVVDREALREILEGG